MQLPSKIPLCDKIVHAVEYGILGILFVRAIAHTYPKESWLLLWATTFFFVALYAMSDEFHQSFVPGRSTDVYDWMADALGGSTAAAVYLIKKYPLKKI